LPCAGRGGRFAWPLYRDGPRPTTKEKVLVCKEKQVDKQGNENLVAWMKSAMSKRQKTWVYNPPKPKVPEATKAEVEAKATELVNTVLKPAHIKPPRKNQQFNYITDIYTKWYRSYFYFCATYACPGPYALSPTFESKFARMEYVKGQRFNLSYMRHTGEWLEIYQDLTLDQCLAII